MGRSEMKHIQTHIQHILFVFLIAVASGVQANTVQSELVVQTVAVTNSSVASPKSAASYDLKFASVPEPEGWTLYLLGLGFVLYQFRRCRNKSRTWNQNHDKNSIE